MSDGGGSGKAGSASSSKVFCRGLLGQVLAWTAAVMKQPEGFDVLQRSPMVSYTTAAAAAAADALAGRRRCWRAERTESWRRCTPVLSLQ